MVVINYNSVNFLLIIYIVNSFCFVYCGWKCWRTWNVNGVDEDELSKYHRRISSW